MVCEPVYDWRELLRFSCSRSVMREYGTVVTDGSMLSLHMPYAPMAVLAHVFSADDSS